MPSPHYLGPHKEAGTIPLSKTSQTVTDGLPAALKGHWCVRPSDPSNMHWLTRRHATVSCSSFRKLCLDKRFHQDLAFFEWESRNQKSSRLHIRNCSSLNRPREFGTTPHPTPKECSSESLQRHCIAITRLQGVVPQCTRLSSLTSNNKLIHYYQLKNSFHCQTERSQGYLCDLKEPLMRVCRDLISGCMVQFNPFNPLFDHLAQVFASL